MAKLIVKGNRKREVERFQRCLMVEAMRPGQCVALVTQRNVQVEVERGPTGYQIYSAESKFDTGPVPPGHAIDFLKRIGAL